jgi:solute carrier family 25 phosphate transporter 23/24/25/41
LDLGAVISYLNPADFLTSRNFLLFLPTNTQTPPLKAVLSYYSSTFALNAEGDTSIREETLEGLGTASPMLFNIFFGAIVQIAKPPPRNPSFPEPQILGPLPPEEATNDSMLEVNHAAHFIESTLGTKARPNFPFPRPSPSEADDQDLSSDIASPEKSLLISLLPDSGYFAIGACAGVISRTCTAPLDRLKVYLIAHISPMDNALDAAKKGNAGEVTRKFGQPIILAYKDLLRSGGWRNLFAGEYNFQLAARCHRSNLSQVMA